MAKYFASAGIRHVLGTNSSWNNLRHYPFIVLFGPSGQACQVPPPSGYAGGVPDAIYPLYGYTQSFNHKAIGSFKNELLISLQTQSTHFSLAFSPEKQTEAIKRNEFAFAPYNNAPLSLRVMFDGTYWKQFKHESLNQYSDLAFLRIADAELCIESIPYASTLVNRYNIYKGKSPTYIIDGGSRSGWKPMPGQYYTPGTVSDHNRVVGMTTAPGNVIDPDGVEFESIVDVAPAACDVIEHNGNIYIVGQYWLYAMVPGSKGNFILFDNANDLNIDDLTETAGYTTRVSTGDFESMSRCFAVHRGTLYMLSANGKVHEVTTTGIKEVADIKLLGTPYASGIVHGSCPVPEVGVWNGTAGRRCYMTSFNNQLHAFLNYSTNWKVAKGTDGTTAGRGVFWGTSFDAVRWSDRSDKLPSSGVISPSGANTASWLSVISPYRFSGKRNHPTLSHFQVFASGNNTESSTLGYYCRPSGYRQVGPVPFWLGSGTLIDTPGTHYANLNVPMQHGVVSGYLAPTFIAYPATYRTAEIPAGSGVTKLFVAEGVSASGYDYNGCTNYHVSGQVNADGDTLTLMFAQDFHGGSDASSRGKVLLYELNRASGWLQKNYLPHVNQLNGLVPLSWNNPDIIIPSGTMFAPNPSVDEINKTVDIEFNIRDYPYWGTMKVIGEYSTNGYEWFEFGRINNISTATKSLDPSGINGTNNVFRWKYDDFLSSHTEYNNVRIRLRAEEM